MERFIEHCCEKCTHTASTPCKNFILCRLDGPICHESRTCADQRKAIVDRVRLNERFVIC